MENRLIFQEMGRGDFLNKPDFSRREAIKKQNLASRADMSDGLASDLPKTIEMAQENNRPAEILKSWKMKSSNVAKSYVEKAKNSKWFLTENMQHYVNSPDPDHPKNGDLMINVDLADRSGTECFLYFQIFDSKYILEWKDIGMMLFKKP